MPFPLVRLCYAHVLAKSLQLCWLAAPNKISPQPNDFILHLFNYSPISGHLDLSMPMGYNCTLIALLLGYGYGMMYANRWFYLRRAKGKAWIETHQHQLTKALTSTMDYTKSTHEGGVAKNTWWKSQRTTIRGHRNYLPRRPPPRAHMMGQP